MVLGLAGTAFRTLAMLIATLAGLTTLGPICPAIGVVLKLISLLLTITSLGAEVVVGRGVAVLVVTGAGGRMRNVCTEEVPEVAVGIPCLLANRTGLDGNRALAAVETTPGKLAPGILSLIMLADDDVGIETGVAAVEARGLNKVD